MSRMLFTELPDVSDPSLINFVLNSQLLTLFPASNFNLPLSSDDNPEKMSLHYLGYVAYWIIQMDGTLISTFKLNCKILRMKIKRFEKE